VEVIGPVTVKLPDIVALPVYGNAAPPPPFKANDAVSAYDELIALEANELLTAFNTYEAVTALLEKLLLTAFNT